MYKSSYEALPTTVTLSNCIVIHLLGGFFWIEPSAVVALVTLVVLDG